MTKTEERAVEQHEARDVQRGANAECDALRAMLAALADAAEAYRIMASWPGDERSRDALDAAITEARKALP